MPRPVVAEVEEKQPHGQTERSSSPRKNFPASVSDRRCHSCGLDSAGAEGGVVRQVATGVRRERDGEISAELV